MTATRRVPTPTFADVFGKKSGLNLREVKKLHALGEPIRLKSGKLIFADGEIASNVYGLSRGIVRIYKTFSDGRRTILRFTLPGEFLELPHAERHSVSAASIGVSSVSRFPRGELLKFLKSSRNMTRSIMGISAQDLAQAQDHMLIVGQATPEEKLIAFLKAWRKHFVTPALKRIPLPMPRRDIAAYLGMAHETVTRTFAVLEEKQLVRVFADGVELLTDQ